MALACVDAGPILPVVPWPPHIIAVMAPVPRRTEPERPNAAFIHACCFDAVTGLIQMVAACWLW